ncbi:unnamed protein product, partial [Allacma fusca]
IFGWRTGRRRDDCQTNKIS